MIGMSAVAGGSSLERSGRVGQDQVHVLGHEAVDNGGAVGGIAGGILLVKLHLARPASRSARP